MKVDHLCKMNPIVSFIIFSLMISVDKTFGYHTENQPKDVPHWLGLNQGPKFGDIQIP